MWGWKPYVSVAERRADAKKKMDKLKKQGKNIQPVEIEGRLIVKKFWGKRWCDHLESFADYENRLPRGRTYVRNGSVCHLNILEGEVEAMVSGSSIYQVVVKITRLPKEKWEAIKKRCIEHVGSLIDFLQGKVSDHVMEVISDHQEGLFPNPKEIKCSCSCPDWADMCKHVAAVLYGVGARLDLTPELLFLLRGVDPSELINTQLNLEAKTSDNQLEEQELADIFGLDFEEANAPIAKPLKAVNSKKARSIELKKTEKNKPISVKPIKVKKIKTTKTEKIKKVVKKKSSPAFDIDCLTGNHIAELRNWHGLSVTEFADRLNISSATIKRWEMDSNQLKLQQSSKDAIKKFIKK